MRTGTMFAVISLAALTGSPIGGELNKRSNGSYKTLQVFCGCMMIGGSTVFLAARVSLAGWKVGKKV